MSEGTKAALKRVIDVYEKRPEQAQSTSRASATVVDGLSCHFTQGERHAQMDMPTTMGGGDSAPTPGFFARAGLTGCVAICIKQAAILADMDFANVTVDLEMDFDDGAMFGLGCSTAAPLQTRLSIRIETGEPESDVTALVDVVLERDPWFLALRDAQSVRAETHVVAAD